jgi:large subunit ribosomal protein L29
MDIKALKNLSETDLVAEMKKLQAELESMRMQARLGQVKAVHRIGEMRKTIARIKTLQALSITQK